MWGRRCRPSPWLRLTVTDAALPILYSFRRCPYAMRARLALAASGQAYEHREVVLRDKPPELLAASIKGTVPVLVLPGGGVIEESLEIMLWALRRNDPQHWLGKQEAKLADCLILISQCDGAFKQHLDAYKYPAKRLIAPGLVSGTGELPEPADPQTRARQHASVFINVLNQQLAHNAYLLGSQGSLADAAIVPFVRQFAGVQPEWFAQAPWPALRAWLDFFTGSAMFVSVMQKQAPWRV